MRLLWWGLLVFEIRADIASSLKEPNSDGARINDN